MSFSEKQKGVFGRILIGAFVSLSLIVYGIVFNPFSYSETVPLEEALLVLAYSLIIPTICLILSIGRLAKHRFFTAEDIDGEAGLSDGSKRAKILQNLLQNTLEQYSLLLSVYIIWAIIMPSSWLSVIPLTSIAFTLGRILFFTRYEKGAIARALGFALTFYPSVQMLACVVLFMVYRVTLGDVNV